MKQDAYKANIGPSTIMFQGWTFFRSSFSIHIITFFNMNPTKRGCEPQELAGIILFVLEKDKILDLQKSENR